MKQEQAFEKFYEIVTALHNYNIELVDIHQGNPVLQDPTCDFEIIQPLQAWMDLPLEQVVQNVVQARDSGRIKDHAEQN